MFANRTGPSCHLQCEQLGRCLSQLPRWEGFTAWVHFCYQRFVFHAGTCRHLLPPLNFPINWILLISQIQFVCASDASSLRMSMTGSPFFLPFVLWGFCPAELQNSQRTHMHQILPMRSSFQGTHLSPRQITYRWCFNKLPKHNFNWFSQVEWHATTFHFMLRCLAWNHGSVPALHVACSAQSHPSTSPVSGQQDYCPGLRSLKRYCKITCESQWLTTNLQIYKLSIKPEFVILMTGSSGSLRLLRLLAFRRGSCRARAAEAPPGPDAGDAGSVSGASRRCRGAGAAEGWGRGGCGRFGGRNRKSGGRSAWRFRRFADRCLHGRAVDLFGLRGWGLSDLRMPWRCGCVCKSYHKLPLQATSQKACVRAASSHRVLCDLLKFVGKPQILNW